MKILKLPIKERYKKIALPLLIVGVMHSMQVLSNDRQNEGWHLNRDKKGIKVYTQITSEFKYAKLRGQMQVRAGINQLASLLSDPAGCSRWVDMCNKAVVHSRLAQHDWYVYTYQDIPWPFANREALNHVTWQQHADGRVTMTVIAVDDDIKESKDAIRITQAHARWQLKPLPAGIIELTVETYIDPAGHLSSWLANKMFVMSLYKSLSSIKQLLSEEAYKNVDAGFMELP